MGGAAAAPVPPVAALVPAPAPATVEGGAMEAGSSRWIEYVRAYAKRHGVSYKRALKLAAPKWRSLKRRVGGLHPH